MKHILLIPALAVMAACATTPVYGPAKSERAEGYLSQQIETGRHRVSYTDKDPIRARNMALLRAAEITLSEGKDWFEITNQADAAAAAYELIEEIMEAAEAEDEEDDEADPLEGFLDELEE
jgi:hypothetical protein